MSTRAWPRPWPPRTSRAPGRNHSRGTPPRMRTTRTQATGPRSPADVASANPGHDLGEAVRSARETDGAVSRSCRTGELVGAGTRGCHGPRFELRQHLPDFLMIAAQYLEGARHGSSRLTR